jgi:hypothetical protein
METETRAKEETVVKALRNDRLDSREFNWENQADRGKIITVLDRLKTIVKKRGNDSERRPSFSKKKWVESKEQSSSSVS